LETGWAAEKTHRRGYPLEMSLAFNGESGQVLRIIIEFQPPKPLGEIQCRENS